MVAIRHLGAGAAIESSCGDQIKGAEMVMLLAHFGADFSICDRNGVSPMMWAVKMNDMLIVHLLCYFGRQEDLVGVDAFGYSCAHRLLEKTTPPEEAMALLVIAKQRYGLSMELSLV